jgi:hypothetical protein
MELIGVPAERVGSDIFDDSTIFIIVANDVFIIISLPKAHPGIVVLGIDAFGGLIFVKCDDLPQTQFHAGRGEVSPPRRISLPRGDINGRGNHARTEAEAGLKIIGRMGIADNDHGINMIWNNNE